MKHTPAYRARRQRKRHKRKQREQEELIIKLIKSWYNKTRERLENHEHYLSMV